eukprot:7838845-Alexandrium_andersonii.AAC.1
MSASLVGSEMCIRDSIMVGRSPSPLRRHPSSSTSLRLGSRQLHASFAVSYTHLTLPTICSV